MCPLRLRHQAITTLAVVIVRGRLGKPHSSLGRAINCHSARVLVLIYTSTSKPGGHLDAHDAVVPILEDCYASDVVMLTGMLVFIFASKAVNSQCHPWRLRFLRRWHCLACRRYSGRWSLEKISTPCGKYPIWLPRWSASQFCRSAPSRRMLPSVGSMAPTSILPSVDLPAPVAPISATSVPRGMSRMIASTNASQGV